MKNTLVFEGAGWDKAETSIQSGVSNCRIRTRIRNNEGRLIYLELGGSQFSGKNIPNYAKGFEFASHIDHCFFCDSKWDERRSHSSELSPLLSEHFEYNKQNILTFVNEKLNCSFTSIEVINDNSVRVHDVKEPLCDCSKPGYTPHKDIEVNISELDGVKPLLDYSDKGFAQYKVGYDFVKQLPYISKWMNDRTDREKQEFPKFTYYFSIRWDNKGIITRLELSARQNFCSMGFGAEILESVISEIKKSSLRKVC